jgi:Ca2+/Na+ antiporter
MMDYASIVRGVFILLAACFLVYLAMEYSKKQKLNDEEESFQEPDMNTDPFGMNGNSLPIGSNSTNVVDSTAANNSQAQPSQAESNFKEIDFTEKKPMDPKACFPKDKLTAEDLLPKDCANSKWAQVNPAGQGDVKDKNYISAGYHVGINTVGTTLRNPNLQLRSEIPNPQVLVSPWNQTTIDMDLNRRPMEIGGCE